MKTERVTYEVDDDAECEQCSSTKGCKFVVTLPWSFHNPEEGIVLCKECRGDDIHDENFEVDDDWTKTDREEPWESRN